MTKAALVAEKERAAGWHREDKIFWDMKKTKTGATFVCTGSSLELSAGAGGGCWAAPGAGFEELGDV